MTPLLRCRGIRKAFPGVTALAGVDFDVDEGEVHALAGENGAGKSTLMHILAGVHQPDAGSIEFQGCPAHIPNERHAQQLGIGIVFQERSLFDLLTVGENIFAGNQPVARGGMIDRARMHAEAAALLQRIGLDVSPSAPLASLSPAQRQMVEIAKALSFNPRLFILDEPTASLTVAETEILFRVVRQLRQGGVGVVYISHRLGEIFQLADRVTVLKDGRVQGTMPVGGVSPDSLVSLMIGRDIARETRHPVPARRGEPALQVIGIAGRKTKPVSFCAWPGEVLVFAGLAGAGRTELARLIFGADPILSGELRVQGKSVRLRSPRDAVAAGIGYVPEDRKELGLFPEMSIAQNIAAADLQRFGVWQLRGRAMEETALAYMQRLNIAALSPLTPVGKLSGGNQQKVLLARWLVRGPAILIVDEPTRGIDAGARTEIYATLRALAMEGKAIVAISSDLPEVLTLADRILVMRQGAISGELPAAEASEEAVMRLAAIGLEELVTQ